ncbi:MAG: hypothetical protein IJ996_00575 [Clostridia bacterium]|nr:hypothetical protein [Clostridia bacterium]
MKKLEPFFDLLGEILAIVLVVTYVILITNGTWNYIEDETVMMVLSAINRFGALALVAVVGLEAMSKRNIIFLLLFVAACAFIFVFLFMPNTFESIMG